MLLYAPLIKIHPILKDLSKVDISYDVPLYSQKMNTCWFAAMRMIYRFHHPEGKLPTNKLWEENKGLNLTRKEHLDIMIRHNFKPVPKKLFTMKEKFDPILGIQTYDVIVNRWAELEIVCALYSFGPLWFLVNKGGAQHCMVITGYQNQKFLINNSALGGKKHKVRYVYLDRYLYYVQGIHNLWYYKNYK